MTRPAVLGALLLGLLPAAVAAQGADRLYTEACEGGDAYVCNLLGIMYEAGEGVSKDLPRAAALYRLACEGGELMGCTNLGLMYEAGLGVDQNNGSALGLFRVACEGGQELGCERLGRAEGWLSFALDSYSKVGRVGDADTGEPLPEAVVELLDLGVRVVSDSNGYFVLDGIPAGTHVIRAERLGYGMLTGEVEFPGSTDLVLLMRPGPVGELDAPGRIEGRVTDGLGNRALSDVEITVLGQPAVQTLSNQDGRFRLRGVDAGLVELRFARLGYAPRTAVLIVQPNRTAEVSATMVTEPIELEAIQVTARPSHLEQNGFFTRYDKGWGTHFTPQDIARIDPIIVSDILRERVPGIRIQYGGAGEARVLTKRASGLSVRDDPATLLNDAQTQAALAGECIMEVYVDGMRQYDQDLDRSHADQIQAVEIYQGIDTPIEFTSSFNACGVVLLWTRRGA